MPLLGGVFLALVFVGLWPRWARAEALREADVIRLVGARDPAVAAAQGEVAVVEAQEIEAGLYPDPVLAWDREHIPGPGALGELEDELSLSVPVDFSGRRQARRSLARAGAASARSDAARARSRAVARALNLFYAAMAAERRVEIARRTVARLAEAARVLGKRHEEGAISGYERTRLEIEAELAESELREVESRALTLRHELALLLGLEPGAIDLSGELAPTTTPEVLAQSDVEARPSIELLRGSLSEARDARESAGWAWVPTVTVTGGLRVKTTDEVRYGYVAGVSLSVPIFSRGQELRAEADARQRVLAARLRSAERSARIESLRAIEELAMASGELERFGAATKERTERLLRAAETGYQEGERSVVELLDAERARAAVESRRLELALAARRADIARRAARGELER